MRATTIESDRIALGATNTNLRSNAGASIAGYSEHFAQERGVRCA